MKRYQFSVDAGLPGVWDERRWAMMKMTRLAATAALLGFAMAAVLIGAASAARAVTTSDKSAAILVWPKVVVDTSGRFGTCTIPDGLPCASSANCAAGGICNLEPTDTVIQITNNSTDRKQAHCIYIDANSHCADNPGVVCQSSQDCPSGVGFSACIPGWSEIDFDVFLTPGQPIGWNAASGKVAADFALHGPGTCTSRPGRQCFRDGDCPFGDTCNLGPSNVGSAVPPVPEDPFLGQLKCIEFDPQSNPSVPDRTATTNSLKGEGTIISVPAVAAAAPTAPVDAQKYNAVGLQATAGPGSAPANQLQLGGNSGAEYAACPQTLILNHLFDGAVDPNGVPPHAGISTTVRTDLTLVPCGDNIASATPGHVTAQFLVFNEFEQRFSTSRTVDCFYESQLSRIDTPNPARSIFNANVAGTVGGQTRIRGVGSAATGRGLIGVARLFVNNDVTFVPSGAGYNLNQQGDPDFSVTQPDVITIP